MGKNKENEERDMKIILARNYGAAPVHDWVGSEKKPNLIRNTIQGSFF
jgi:hypothetical protein